MNPPESRNILRHELISLDVRVVESTNPALIGVEGKVVDETMNTMTIRCEGKDRILPKKASTFLFRLPSGEKIEIDGRQLMKRPEDRVKMRVKRVW